MTYEQMMEKSWVFIHELGITDEIKEFGKDPDSHYLVENILAVRDAYCKDLEESAEAEENEEDLPGFFERHGIKWE